jgi:hypothetical protein
MPFDQAGKTEAVLCEFCREFLEHPYLCYTEHGLHALFFARLYQALPPEERYLEFAGRKVSVVQKEYPTHHHLGRPRRQNWDISVIEKPPVAPNVPHPYDHLKLAAVVEFGLNYDEDHIAGDIDRLSHESANVGLRLIAHLYRLGLDDRISSRVRSTDSTKIYTRPEILSMLQGKQVTVYYGLHDESGKRASGLWKLTADGEDGIPLRAFGRDLDQRGCGRWV